MTKSDNGQSRGVDTFRQDLPTPTTSSRNPNIKSARIAPSPNTTGPIFSQSIRGRKEPDRAIATATLGTVPDDAVSEDSVALAFAATHGDTLRYDHAQRRWYRWDTDHWRRDDTRLAFAWARDLARYAAANLSRRDRQRIGKAAFCTGVERLAQADRTLAVTQEVWDRDPFLLGAPGGMVDLRTGDLLPSDPSSMITRRVAVTPAPTADCPRWMRFLDEATGGDVAMIRFLQQWSGYALTGDTREHALLFVFGEGGNGKSVLINTLSGILGDYAATADMSTFAASKGDRHPTDLAMLAGARLVTASETEEGRAWAESRIKALTGGDPITARYMRAYFFTYRPQFKLIVVGNHAPILANVDNAARRRFNIVPFTRRPVLPDPTLEAQLKDEWPGILCWAIRGCLDWQANGLIRPQAVVEATAAYFADQDLVGTWLAEKAVVEPGNESMWVTAAQLFASWADFAQAMGETVGTARSLGLRLARKGLQKAQKRSQGQNVRVWLGVELYHKAIQQEHDQDQVTDATDATEPLA